MITHQESLQKFHTQLEYVLANYTPHNLNIGNYQNIVIAGLGGSGIGGRLVKSFFYNQLPVPVEVVSDYTLPAFVSQNTLLILSSYSGNTEETLSIFNQGKELGCTMIAITAGGQLMQLAQQNNVKIYTIEGGFQPRMALGYSFGYLLKIFAGLLSYNIDDDFNDCIENLKDQDEHMATAQEIVKKFKSSLNSKYVIIADAQFEAVGIRACQQFQENAKKEAFCNVLPEANHNVIESYYGKLDTNFILLNSGSNERVSARFDFVGGLLEKENNKVIHLAVEEFNLKMVFSLIHKLDWVTIMVAEETFQNPMEIENIISLKDFLSNN